MGESVRDCWHLMAMGRHRFFRDVFAILEKIGIEVKLFSSGAELEARGRRTPFPRLVLLDGELAEFDLVQFIRRWKRDPVLYFPFMVVAFGDAEHPRIREVLRAGANLTIHPPMELTGLVSELDQEARRFAGLRLPHEGSVCLRTSIEFFRMVNTLMDMLRHSTRATDEELVDLKLCLGELGANALQHGNAGDTTKTVAVNYRVEAGGVSVSIEDEGPGFDPDALPDPTSPGRLLVPSGRGIFLVRQFADELIYNPAGNRVRLVKRFR